MGTSGVSISSNPKVISSNPEVPSKWRYTNLHIHSFINPNPAISDCYIQAYRLEY